MATNRESSPQHQARTEQVRSAVRRASLGRVLVAFAVFAPVLLILGLFLLSQGHIYNHHYTGPRWPWIAVDVVLLLIGMRMMRGEDL